MLFDQIEASAAAIRRRTAVRPEVAVILGTGLGGLAGRIESPTIIDYADIPGFPLSTVESHAGRLLLGTLAGRSILDRSHELLKVPDVIGPPAATAGLTRNVETTSPRLYQV